MIITRAYKTKLKPTPDQILYFGGCADAARFVYNWAERGKRALPVRGRLENCLGVGKTWIYDNLGLNEDD